MTQPTHERRQHSVHAASVDASPFLCHYSASVLPPYRRVRMSFHLQYSSIRCTAYSM